MFPFRYRHALANRDSHIMSQYVVIGILTVLCFMFWSGWVRAPRNIRIDIPPDLRSGASVRPGEYQPVTAYAFTLQVFQKINLWKADGAKEYPQAIYSASAFLTPKFRQELELDVKTKAHRGELRGRARTVQEYPGRNFTPQRVEMLGQGVWIVWLDLDLEETVQGEPVKRAPVRYGLRVVTYDVEQTLNPWGLALDGFVMQPKRLTDADLASDQVRG
jgi:integrating conjugative element protein (TIGR03746 family)